MTVKDLIQFLKDNTYEDMPVYVRGEESIECDDELSDIVVTMRDTNVESTANYVELR
jgi:hypothetical protein